MSNEHAAPASGNDIAPPRARPEGRVYSNLGWPKVTIERDGAAVDMHWWEWVDLVARVGNRFVDWALANPEGLRRVRSLEYSLGDPRPPGNRASRRRR